MTRFELKNVLDQGKRRADHWVELEPMSGNDMLALATADEGMADLLRRMGRAVTDHDFLTTDATGAEVKADILDQPWTTLRKILPLWRSASEEDALPQA